MTRKKRMHKPSLLHCKDGTCYLCMLLHDDYRTHHPLHEHHIFGGSNRSISEAEGMKVYLCINHHVVGTEAVHNNQTNMRLLQQEGQRVYEQIHTREQFMQLFGQNYLDEKEG